MQKNNKNNQCRRIIKVKQYFYRLLTLLLLMVGFSAVAQAQLADTSEQLAVQIEALEVQITHFISESVNNEQQIATSDTLAQDLQSQIAHRQLELASLDGQNVDLIAEITLNQQTADSLNERGAELTMLIASSQLQLDDLSQQRITVATAAASQEAELLESLSVLKSRYDNLQRLIDRTLAQFDSRLSILQQYQAWVGSNNKRLQRYLDAYIKLFTRIRARYVAVFDRLKSTWMDRISQQEAVLEQLRAETSLLLSALDEELTVIQKSQLLMKQELGVLESQLVLLASGLSALKETQASVQSSIGLLDLELAKLADELEQAIQQGLQLVADNEALFLQIEALQTELAQLLEQLAALQQGEEREQNIAQAKAALEALSLGDSGRCQANHSAMLAIACFESGERQIVRITHAQLLALGINLTGVPKVNIGALSQGNPVPVFVAADDLFDENSFIELLTTEHDSIYSETRSYLVYVDFAQEFSQAVSAVTSTESDGSQSQFVVSTTETSGVVSHYTDSLHYEQDDIYSISGLSDYGWTDSNGFRYIYPSETKQIEMIFTLDAQALLDQYADLSIHYAKSAFNNDQAKTHVYLNGVPLGAEHIDQAGRGATVLLKEVGPGVLQLGDNTLSLQVTNIGAARMSFQFDKFTLDYQRRLVAKQGALFFSAQPGQYVMSGVSHDDADSVVAFKQGVSGQWHRMTPLVMLESGSSVETNVETSTETNTATADVSLSFFVDETAALTVDKVESNLQLTLPRTYQDIVSPHAEYLVISPAEFITTSAMQDLVHLRETEYSVQVVEVDQVYAQYAQGTFDALAIKRFIGDKMANSGTQMVLLIGDDTYDYKEKLNLGEQSVMPSLYLDYPYVMATDLLYVDQNDDQLPEIAIGRFPVETVEEFANVVEKTLTFSQNTYSKKAVLATNYSDGYGPTHYHPALESVFSSSWFTIDALMTQDSIAERDAAKNVLLDMINYRGGSGLLVYTGHNSLATGPMFSSLDIPLLANQGIPTTAVMIDSYTGFYVADQFTDSIGVQAEDLLVAKGVGAAAVFAPSSTIGLQTVQTRFLWRISRNYTYGEAYLNAMQASYGSGTASYNLLGDPGLRLNTL